MSKAASDGFRESADSGLEGEAVDHETASILPAIDGSAEANSNEGAAESDPFAGSAEDHAANETRRKIELFEWADSVLGLNETELELALDDAVKRFGMQRRALNPHSPDSVVNFGAAFRDSDIAIGSLSWIERGSDGEPDG